jgi:hypothetical protein
MPKPKEAEMRVRYACHLLSLGWRSLRCLRVPQVENRCSRRLLLAWIAAALRTEFVVRSRLRNRRLEY